MNIKPRIIFSIRARLAVAITATIDIRILMFKNRRLRPKFCFVAIKLNEIIKGSVNIKHITAGDSIFARPASESNESLDISNVTTGLPGKTPTIVKILPIKYKAIKKLAKRITLTKNLNDESL